MKFVIALGGNMISDAKRKGEQFEEQLAKINATAKTLVSLIEAGHTITVTHGNGPQVGSLLLQQQAGVAGSTSLPLNILGALTQGQIGVSLQHAFINEFRLLGIEKNVYVIPTTVIVDKHDPGFENPTKPVGPFYSELEYAELEKLDYQYTKKKEGYRRVVASPLPVKVLEVDLIKQLMDQDNVVIAVGGGGSPTIDNGKLTLVDAVIDKDMASSLLARNIDADVLLILTNVDGVYTGFGTDDQKLYSKLSKIEAEKLLETDEFGEGSMKPKVKAVINFLEPGKLAIITSPEHVLAALEGLSGTSFTI